uniref:Uncharacterized protein n=1 Tax=Timema monikensis TaxID=170555 RepID=A0A7R9HR43_9NEOP|nr:unnamed protein product [Timema monikensis]
MLSLGLYFTVGSINFSPTERADTSLSFNSHALVVLKPTAEDGEIEILKEFEDKANEKLQMPPVVKIRKDEQKVLDIDPALQGYSDAKFVFTDITYGLSNKERLVVVRDPDGTLREASMQEHCRTSQLYVPMLGRQLTPPPMFQEEYLKCKLAFCKTIADECQPFLQRFQTSKPMTPYLFEAVEKLLRYLMNRCVKPDLMKCTGPKLLSIDTKKSENLILSKNIDIGFATKRLLGETAITVTERQKLEFIHECRSMLTTMIAKLQEKSPLKQKAVRGLSSLDPCVIQHSPQLAQKRFSFLLEELNHANIINDVLAENAKKEYLHFCNLKKSELQEIFRPCDQFSDEVGLDTIYGSFLIGDANYKHLWEVIKICLVLSHGNATVEGGFSVNKSLLVENMHEKTVIAQRHIHDEIQEAGGIKNIHISKKMLDYVRGARKRYHEYLEMKKQEKSEKDKKKAEKRKLDIQLLLEQGEYEFILDRACVQFEPDDPEYHRVTQATYDHIDNCHKYETLRSTRHFGPFAFYLAWHRQIDNLILESIHTDRLDEAVALIQLFHILNPESKSASVAYSSQQVQFVQAYVKSDAVKKSMLELALQTFMELQKQRQEVEEGIQKAHLCKV